jgi:hypothetical protein
MGFKFGQRDNLGRTTSGLEHTVKKFNNFNVSVFVLGLVYIVQLCFVLCPVYIVQLCFVMCPVYIVQLCFVMQVSNS